MWFSFCAWAPPHFSLPVILEAYGSHQSKVGGMTVASWYPPPQPRSKWLMFPFNCFGALSLGSLIHCWPGGPCIERQTQQEAPKQGQRFFSGRLSQCCFARLVPHAHLACPHHRSSRALSSAVSCKRHIASSFLSSYWVPASGTF